MYIYLLCHLTDFISIFNIYFHDYKHNYNLICLAITRKPSLFLHFNFFLAGASAAWDDVSLAGTSFGDLAQSPAPPSYLSESGPTAGSTIRYFRFDGSTNYIPIANKNYDGVGLKIDQKIISILIICHF